MRYKNISQTVGILLCLATGTSILLIDDVIPRWQSVRAAKSWVKVEAVLTRHSLELPQEGSAYSIIEYKYHYGNKDYSSNKYSFERRKPLLSSPKYIEGMKLVCYVNPQKPFQAVLSTEKRVSGETIVFSLLFILGGFLFIALVIYNNRKLKKHPNADVPGDYIDDPVANKTEWAPLPDKIGRGSSFQVYKLSEDGISRYCYLPTLYFFLFCAILFSTAIYLIIGYRKDIFGVLCGFLILILAFCCFLTAKKFVFDHYEKAFWYTNFFRYKRKYAYTPFKDIYALQIIYKLDLGDGGGFSDYQINLVLTNGKRIYLISQPTLGKAQENAQLLSSFIGCLVWTKPY